MEPSKKPLVFLNISQFCGVLNDNLYKFILIFFSINLLGTHNAGLVLSMAGVLSVLPFIIFVTLAGSIADRFNKRNVMLALKLTEIVIILLSFPAFQLKILSFCYILLFLLSIRSAIFGPLKLGIIPEIVSRTNIAKANSWITAFSSLGIILGTVLSSFLFDISGRAFFLPLSFSLLLALIGLLSTLLIKRTYLKNPQQKIKIFSYSEIKNNFSHIRKIPLLGTSILLSALFLSLGAFFQLGLISFAKSSLKMSETAGGYLFLMVAFGIILGSFIASKLVKREIKLKLSCMSLAIIGLLLVLLHLSSKNLPISIVMLVIIGIFGGLLVVPSEAFIQINSPEKERGRIIATSNFLGFTGTMLSAFIIYIFDRLIKLEISETFGLIGIITIIIALILKTNLPQKSKFLS